MNVVFFSLRTKTADNEQWWTAMLKKKKACLQKPSKLQTWKWTLFSSLFRRPTWTQWKKRGKKFLYGIQSNSHSNCGEKTLFLLSSYKDSNEQWWTAAWKVKKIKIRQFSLQTEHENELCFLLSSYKDGRRRTMMNCNVFQTTWTRKIELKMRFKPPKTCPLKPAKKRNFLTLNRSKYRTQESLPWISLLLWRCFSTTWTRKIESKMQIWTGENVSALAGKKRGTFLPYIVSKYAGVGSLKLDLSLILWNMFFDHLDTCFFLFYKKTWPSLNRTFKLRGTTKMGYRMVRKASPIFLLGPEISSRFSLFPTVSWL